MRRFGVTEAEEQIEIVKWFRETWPEHSMSLRCSLNGLNLGSSKRGAILIKHAKRLGMVIGEADLVILLPKGGHGALLIEHKRLNGTHRATEAQKEYIQYHNSIGNHATVTVGINEAKSAIREYMSL